LSESLIVFLLKLNSYHILLLKCAKLNLK
jgi:hypothetical protein